MLRMKGFGVNSNSAPCTCTACPPGESFTSYCLYVTTIYQFHQDAGLNLCYADDFFFETFCYYFLGHI